MALIHQFIHLVYALSWEILVKKLRMKFLFNV